MCGPKSDKGMSNDKYETCLIINLLQEKLEEGVLSSFMSNTQHNNARHYSYHTGCDSSMHNALSLAKYFDINDEMDYDVIVI